MKILVLIFLLCGIAAQSQVMQTTGGAGGNKFRALKADSFLVVPSGADTTNLANPKWQESTTGAIFVKTTDSTLWFKVGGKWVQAGSGGTGGGGGGTITNISFRAGTVVDTLYFTDSGGDTDFYYVVVKDGLISGGVVTYTGFARTYAISAALFRKNGQFYTTNDTTITIAALSDPDSSRSDVFVVNTSGQATTLTGVESANPLTPQIDPDTEVYLTHVTLSPSAPSAGIDTTVIYDENTEWVGGASGVTVNFAGTTTPYRGTKVTDVSAINSGDIIGYGTGTAVNRTSYAGISLFLKLKATMPNNNNILVSFFNGNTQVSSEVVLPITKTNTTSYQGLSLGFDAFSFTNNLFDSVRFRYSGSGITGLYLDFIYLQNGMAPVVINPGTDFVQNIRRVGDNIEQQKNGVWTPVIDISDKKSGTVTSVATNNFTGLIGGTITTGGTLYIDTTIISTRAWRDKLADSLGAIIATKGSGTVTNFSAGDLSPLFTTSEATTTTTPALSFSLSNAGSYTVFGNQTNASAAPSFAKLNINTIDATGTPSATTYLRGDGSWASAGGGSSELTYVSDSISYYVTASGKNGVGTNAGRRNIFVGKFSGFNLTNTASGDSATTNIGIGNHTLTKNTTGFRNVAIGNATPTDTAAAPLHLNTRGSRNVAIGSYALNVNTTGSKNLAIGESSLGANTTGNGNIASGFESLRLLASGDFNVAIGENASRSTTGRSNTVAIGLNAATGGFGGNGAIAIGNNSASNGLGAASIAIGENSYGGTGIESTTVGQYAGNFGNGTKNVAVGSYAAYTSGNKSRTTAVGHGAGVNITTGSGNTMLGADILNVGGSTTGSFNVGIGYPNAALTFTSLSASYQININNSIVRNASGQFFLNTNTTPSSIPTFTTSAALEINGTSGAVLFPRLTTTQRDALTATDGMVIYNTTASKLQVRAGGAWVDLH